MALVSTTLTGNPAEVGFTLAAAALDRAAREHKRLEAQHRRAAQTFRAELARLRSQAASCGVVITPSEGE